MKRFTPAVLAATAILATLAGAAMLGGCAADGQKSGDTYADASYTPVGTYIPRKKVGTGVDADGVTRVDKQALENDRTMGGGTINLPQR